MTADVPQDRAVALFHLRTRIAKQMSDMVQNPAKYNNADVLDALRDIAKANRLQFLTRKDAHQRAIIHVYIRDPISEPMDPRPVTENPQYLGWVEKNTEPTPDRGG